MMPAQPARSCESAAWSCLESRLLTSSQEAAFTGWCEGSSPGHLQGAQAPGVPLGLCGWQGRFCSQFPKGEAL